MNIFLTGNVQVGKSTILNRFISSHPDLKIGGFKTLTNFDENRDIYRGVYKCQPPNLKLIIVNIVTLELGLIKEMIILKTLI